MNTNSLLMSVFILSISAVQLSACKTTDVPITPQVKSTLGDAEFKQLVDTAYFADTYTEREQKFTSLMARDDLTTRQRATAYWTRGTSRGVWVNDGPYASPYCSVQDLETALTMDPELPKKQAALKNIDYQKSRYQYFEKPKTCGE